MLKVLVVGDESLSSAVKRGLPSAKVSVETGAREAVKRIFELESVWDRYDVVVCDRNTAGLQAEDVLRTVRGCRERSMVILVTGPDDRSEVAGVADVVLCKPFGFRELAEAIAMVVDARSRRSTRRLATYRATA